MIDYYLVSQTQPLTPTKGYTKHIVFRSCINMDRVLNYIEINNIVKYSIYTFTNLYIRSTYTLIVRTYESKRRKKYE